MNLISIILNWFQPEPCSSTQYMAESEQRLSELTVHRKVTISSIIRMSRLEDEFGGILEKGATRRGTGQ